MSQPYEMHITISLRPNTSNNFFCPTNSLKLTDLIHETTTMADSSFTNIVLPQIWIKLTVY